MMSLNSVARYFGQSLIITSANLSSPKRIGATTNAMRSSMKACAAGSLRSTCRSGIGIGRRVAEMALLIVLLLGRRLPADGCDLRSPVCTPEAGVHRETSEAEKAQPYRLSAPSGAKLTFALQPGLEAPLRHRYQPIRRHALRPRLLQARPVRK